jgi:hypothetical protein
MKYFFKSLSNLLQIEFCIEWAVELGVMADLLCGWLIPSIVGYPEVLIIVCTLLQVVNNVGPHPHVDQQSRLIANILKLAEQLVSETVDIFASYI